MKEYDGLKLLVQFYENHGRLEQVSEKTSVPVEKIKNWLRGGELSQENRELLSKDVHPAFTGEVRAG